MNLLKIEEIKKRLDYFDSPMDDVLAECENTMYPIPDIEAGSILKVHWKDIEFVDTAYVILFPGYSEENLIVYCPKLVDGDGEGAFSHIIDLCNNEILEKIEIVT